MSSRDLFERSSPGAYFRLVLGGYGSQVSGEAYVIAGPQRCGGHRRESIMSRQIHMLAFEKRSTWPAPCTRSGSCDCVHDLGFRALRVMPWPWDLPPSDRRYYPRYAENVELGIPFCPQVGHTRSATPVRAGPAHPYLDTVALKFSSWSSWLATSDIPGRRG